MKFATTLLICLFLSAATATAQSSNQKKPTWEQQIDSAMPTLKEVLELDGLQEAAIRNIMLNQMRQSNMLSKEVEFDETRKRQEYSKLMEDTDADIKKLLRPDQIEMYEAYKKVVRKGKKPTKKKKS